MPIGVPRIIYCWGEELPAQWTDIYNFIFRRRMVFLMQYLDDELCNQICGLLINIHMEDRSKELEKKETERSGVFKSSASLRNEQNSSKGPLVESALGSNRIGDERQKGMEGLGKSGTSFYNKKSRSMEDLLNADEDLGIDDIDTLEQYTLQKITTEWLNWNAQFFDYSDEPYLFYLAELLSKDFNKSLNNLSTYSSTKEKKMNLFSIKEVREAPRSPSFGRPAIEALPPTKQLKSTEESSTTYLGGDQGNEEISKLLNMLKNKKDDTSLFKKPSFLTFSSRKKTPLTMKTQKTAFADNNVLHSTLDSLRVLSTSKVGYFAEGGLTSFINKANMQMGEVYSAFRTNTNFSTQIQAPFLKTYYPPFTLDSILSTSETHGSFSNKQLTKTTQGLSVNKSKKEKLLQMFQEYQNFSNSFFKKPRKSLGNNAHPSPSSLLYKKAGRPAIESLSPTSAPDNFGGVYDGNGKLSTSEKQNNEVFKLLSISNLLSNLAQKNFSSRFNKNQAPLSSRTFSSPFEQQNKSGTSLKNFENSSEQILGQKNLRRSFSLENNLSKLGIEGGGIGSSPRGGLQEGPRSLFETAVRSKATIKGGGLRSQPDFSPKNFSYAKSLNYLSSSSSEQNSSRGFTNKQGGSSQSEFRDYYRKQTERALIEEESKKVFVIINSFGGSVGNGVTVHDALQFIKAGSLTLALGVAASAASLALAGGTIGERYVTEGCHVMIHQPESGLQGQASDIWIDSQEIMKIRLDVAEIYSLSTYRPRHKILRDLDRDFYLTATETIQYGLADEIATNEVMHEIIEMTSKVWDYHDSKQQRLLESRESASSGLDTQTQN